MGCLTMAQTRAPGGKMSPKIRLPYLQSYRSDGRLYFYVRRKGRPRVRLTARFGTDAFMAEYQAALDSEPSAPQPRHGAGSLGAVIAAFYGSADFANLKPNSQRLYRIALDSIAEKHGHRPARTMPPEAATKIIESIGATRPGLANLTKKVMHRVMKHAKIKPNPFADITSYKQGTHHTWTEAELAAFEKRWPSGTRERLAYALLLHTGQRGGDVVRMRRQDISNNAIHVVQEKTNVELWIPIAPELHAAMKATPVKGMHLIGDVNGQPITRRTLTHLMKRAAAETGLPPRCIPHGLRKAILRRLAESGGTAKELQSISGHATLTEIERYTKAADQKRLSAAAIAKLKRRTRVSNQKKS
jgi:integrase